MITDPKFAPARPELTFLRRRVRPKQQAAAPAASTAPAAPSRPSSPSSAASSPVASSGPKIDYTRRDRTPPAPPPPPARPASPPPARPASPPSRPTPPPSRPTPPSAPTGGGSLDLSDLSGPSSGSSSGTVDYTRPGSSSSGSSSSGSSSSGSSSSSSLDLSGGAAPSPSPASRRAAPPSPQPLPAWLEKHVTRVGGRQQHIMSVQAPTVTLTRVQSGVGELTIEAFCSPEIGDLRLGAAYQLRSGGSGIVQHADGNRFGPSSRRPVLVGSREEYEHLGVDLRQVADIERIAVYAYSQSRATITWGGTLVVSTFGGARLELPLERLYPGPLAVLMTFYNMDGELVVRAEMENIAGDIREAARAYGFDRITWRDERTPVE